MTPEERAESLMFEAKIKGKRFPDDGTMERWIATTIRAALAEEREELIAWAESQAEELDREAAGESLMASQGLYGQASGFRQLAAAIRARGQP